MKDQAHPVTPWAWGSPEGIRYALRSGNTEMLTIAVAIRLRLAEIQIQETFETIGDAFRQRDDVMSRWARAVSKALRR